MTVAQSPTPAAAGKHEHCARLRGRAVAPQLIAPALMDGVIGRLAAARRLLPHAAMRVQLIGEARTIIRMLRGSLDVSAGCLAVNLDDVYEYMSRQLAKALWQDGGDLLSEVAHLMHEVRSAWFALPHAAPPGTVG